MIPVNLWVPGTPRPKGSMRHVGKGRLVEQLAGSGDWRAAVAAVAHEAVRSEAGTVQLPYPIDFPVRVTIRLQFEAPKKPRWERPSTRATGDIDKHARNILDALQDARVIADDCLVASLRVAKHYCHGFEIPGAHILIAEADE